MERTNTPVLLFPGGPHPLPAGRGKRKENKIKYKKDRKTRVTKQHVPPVNLHSYSYLTTLWKQLLFIFFSSIFFWRLHTPLMVFFFHTYLFLDFKLCTVETHTLEGRADRWSMYLLLDEEDWHVTAEPTKEGRIFFFEYTISISWQNVGWWHVRRSIKMYQEPSREADASATACAHTLSLAFTSIGSSAPVNIITTQILLIISS